MIAHCLFEQSGTFKNEFIKLGYEAYDYDIQNEYGQTDYQIDLFSEINRAFLGGGSIFDKIGKEDIILAFFPCTRFEARVPLLQRGEAVQMKNWTDTQKLEYAMKINEELNEFYQLISKLAIVCIKKELRLVIENPYTAPHYLTERWPLKPKVIDKDRTLNGDKYKKPTQYFFIGHEPQGNVIFEPITYKAVQTISRTKKENGKDRQTRRSEIEPEYANRFIRQFIIEGQA